MSAKDLVGAWQMTSAVFEFVDGEKVNMFGSSPAGRIVFTDDGWMVALLTDGRTDAEADDAALLRSMLAYSGRYRVEGTDFVTAVDVAWRPMWMGTEQKRGFERAGDKLTILTAELAHPLYEGRRGRSRLEFELEA